VETALLALEGGIAMIPHLGYDDVRGVYGNDAVVAEIVRVLTASEATPEEEQEAIVRDTKTRFHAVLTGSPTLHPHMESGAITAPELTLGKWDWDHSLVIPISGKTQFSYIGVSIQDANTFRTHIRGINRFPTSIAGLGYPLTWKEEYGGYATTNLTFTSFQQIADEIHRLVVTPEPPSQPPVVTPEPVTAVGPSQPQEAVKIGGKSTRKYRKRRNTRRRYTRRR
jgi:hypothetical protein